MSKQRADGLAPGHEFFAILLYDKDGFYTSVVGLCRDAVVSRAYQRSHGVKSLVACSLAFEGKWIDVDGVGLVPDVSPPPEFKEALAQLDHGSDN